MIKFKKNNSITLVIILAISVGLTGLTGCKQSTNKDIPTSPNSETNSQSNTPTTKPAESTTKPAENSTNTSKPAPSTTTPATQPKEVYYGQWVIKQVLAYGSAGTYSKEDAESLLSKSLSFSEGKASGFGEQPSDITKVAANPVYKKTVISKSDFITTYRMTFDKLGVKADSISEITVSDSKGTVCIFFIKDDNTLIIYGGDTYFELVRKTS